MQVKPQEIDIFIYSDFDFDLNESNLTDQEKEWYKSELGNLSYRDLPWSLEYTIESFKLSYWNEFDSKWEDAEKFVRYKLLPLIVDRMFYRTLRVHAAIKNGTYLND